MDQQVPYASYHLENEANEWWQAISKALQEYNVEINWNIFEGEIWARFGPTDGDDFDEALAKIHQMGTLRDYQREFERLQNKVYGWTQKVLVGTFIGGLQPSIADHIRMFMPQTLKDAIMYARMRDEQIHRQKKQTMGTAPSSRTVSNITSPTPTHNTNIAAPKKLSWEELKAKCSLGLCFSCDERFVPGHKCMKPQLFVMENQQDEEEEYEKHKVGIALQALIGDDSSKTLQIRVTINGQEMVALIDTGSTHNFVSEQAAKRMDLKTTLITSFNVKAAIGHFAQCHRVYRNLVMEVEEVSFVNDFFLFYHLPAPMLF